MLLAFFTSAASFAQEADDNKDNDNSSAPAPADNIVSHKVELGETIMLISKKYKVTPRDIYELNPEAIHGITSNEIIKVPLHKSIRSRDNKSAKDTASEKKAASVNIDPDYNRQTATSM